MNSIRTTLVDKCMDSIQNNSNHTEEDLIKIKYGVQILIINIEKLIILIMVASILGMLKYSLFCLLCFGILRLFAAGVHADSSIKCNIINLVVFIVGPCLILHINLNSYILTCMFLASFLLVAFYAPADTKERPLINKNLRKGLKIKAILTVCISYFIFIKIDIYPYKELLAYSILIGSLCIIPFIYKLFKKEYKNYEKIKQA